MNHLIFGILCKIKTLFINLSVQCSNEAVLLHECRFVYVVNSI